MYQYNDFDRQFVNERVAHYRAQTKRYLNGALSEDEFLQFRLRNGLYIQRLAPMLRVAIPYGTLSTAQLRALASIANTYDRGYGHLSTRQNMQFNWPEIADVPDILEQLAAVNMHAIQTSGSCIRNVTTDHFAGAAADESIDPRPYCELIRQWSTLHPEFEWLPRKFKIAVSGGKVDRAAIEVHDIGLRVYEDAQQPVFDVIVGGGLGRTPVIGTTIRKGLPAHHLLTYLHAILRVYNRYGRRDNKYKARIKILLRALGAEAFTQRVDEEWQKVIDVNLTSTFYLCKSSIKKMLKSKSGKIINITSVVGHTGNLGQANYTASKAGIVAMSKSLAIEYAKKNINVNCISPGFIKTTMTDKLDEKFKELIISKIPSARFGEPSDIANAVLFLASDQANYINGETIHVNGGMYMA